MKNIFPASLLFFSAVASAYPLAESITPTELSKVHIAKRNDVWQPRSPGFFDKLKELGESLEDEIKEQYDNLKDQLDKVKISPPSIEVTD